MKVAVCPECGEPGYLERRLRGHNTYLYVVHTYYVSNADGRRMRRRKRCYLGAEDRYKHVDGKLGLGLSSPYTMTAPKLLLALERLLDMIDAKTANMPGERRRAAQILLKYAGILSGQQEQEQSIYTPANLRVNLKYFPHVIIRICGRIIKFVDN
jgi:hypothetical protein